MSPRQKGPTPAQPTPASSAGVSVPATTEGFSAQASLDALDRLLGRQATARGRDRRALDNLRRVATSGEASARKLAARLDGMERRQAKLLAEVQRGEAAAEAQRQEVARLAKERDLLKLAANLGALGVA